MSRTDDKLTKALVADTSTWRLVLRIEDDALEVVLYSNHEDNTLIHRRIDLGTPTAATSGAPNPRGVSRLQLLEDAIYDNPLLLGDYASVYCIVATERFIIAPLDYAADADDCARMMQIAYPGFDGELICAPTGSRNATLLMGIDTDLAAFLNRTFLNPRICHPLSPLCRYYMSTGGKSNAPKTFVTLRDTSLDLIIIDKGNLLLANTFKFAEPSDALYYIMAARHHLNLDDTAHEVMVAGSSRHREDITSLLRKYIARVMPVIFPSRMFKAGTEAMHAPFDLIVMPLCE